MATQANIEIVLASGAKAGQTLKELQQTANRLNREIKNLKPGSDAFVKKTKDFQKVTGRLKEVRGEVKGVSQNQKILNSQMLQFLPFGPKIGSVANSFRLVNGSIGGTTKGMKALKVAIAGTGIGLLIVALGSLVTYLQSTQEGMDKVNSVLRPLNAILQRTIGLVQDLGGKAFKGLGESIKNPKQALIDFGNFIKDNFLNRIKSIGVAWKGIQMIFDGDIKGGFKELANSQIQLVTGIENGIDKIANAAEGAKNWIDQGIEAGTRIDELQKSIEKTEIELTVARANLNAEYQKSKELAQDQSKSDEERLKAARAAQRAQNQLLKIEQKFLDLKIEKMKEEQALNDTSRADKLELAKLEAERTNFEAQAARKRASAKALENQVDREIAAEQKATDKEVLAHKKQMLQEEVEARKNIQDLVIETMDEGLDKEIAQLQLATDRKIEEITGSESQIAEQKALLLEQQLKQEQKIRDKYDKKEQAKKDKVRNEDAQKEQKLLDLKRGILDAGYAAASESIQAGIELLGKDKASREKYAAAIKAMETANIAVGLAAEIQAIWKYANENPMNALFPGAANVIAAVKTIAAVARAGSATSKINSQKFSMGGVLSGPSHAQGGIPIEAEGDEIILTKGVYRDPSARALASELNYAFGGVRFMEAGGPVNPLGQSSNPPSESEINKSSVLSMDTVVSAVNALAAKVDTWQRNLKVYNVVQDTREGLQTINTLEQDAGF